MSYGMTKIKDELSQIKHTTIVEQEWMVGKCRIPIEI